ncbi:MAG: hypothetical protein ACE5GS_08775 [Kiloniellaceae bacterium]
MTDPSQITDLLKIISRLIGVLEREIEMLRAMKPSELQALQQDKIVLAAAYEAQFNALKDRPELLETAAPRVRAELKAAVDRFQKTLSENERSLRAAKDVTARVLRAIADELGRKQRENAAYAPDGTVAARAGPREPLSVTYDERL